MLEFLQIISLSLTYIGFLPEIYDNFKNPDDKEFSKLYIWLIWMGASLSTAIYFTINNIDFLVCLYSYGNILFYTIIISKKINNILNNK
jgi:hypothetical protein